MSRGRRYNGEQKLNLKKVAAVVISIIIIILFVIGIKQIFKADKETIAGKNIELTYNTLFTNGNWGVINSSGEIVIEPANGEMIVIPNKTKPVFICTYEVNYVDGTYKTKAINDKNQQIFTDYDNVMAIQNYDENNNLWIEDSILKVQKDGKYGLINIDGNVVLPCEYDSITVLKGVKNSIITKKDSKVGLVNSKGTEVIPVEYDEIQAVTSDYLDGYIVKNSEGNYGVISPEGKVALECSYEKIDNIKDGNKYIVKSEGKWKVLAEDGAVYLEDKVSNVADMKNGDVIVINEGKYGVLNIATDAKIPAEYEDLKFAFEDKFIAKKDGKYGIIDANNEVIIDFKYADIITNKLVEYIKADNGNGTFDYIAKNLSVKFTAGDEAIFNGFIRVRVSNEYKYYNFKLDEKTNKDVYVANTLFTYKENGKYGFKDKDGKVVVEAKYDDATEQNDCGYVAIKKDGKWGSLDQFGNVVVEPKYNLDNNEEIDFIGKWHVSADMNANYYTDAE